MPKKQVKKKTGKKKMPSSNKKASKKAKKKAPSKKKPKLKKSVARSAIRKAVAKRAKTTRKKPAKKKAGKKRPAGKKTVKRKPARKKAAKKKMARKHVSRRKPLKKKPAKRKLVTSTSKKKALKEKPAKSAKSASLMKHSKPKIKEKKPKGRPSAPERELNRAEISKLLSDSYARHLIIEFGGEHALEIVRGFSNNSSDEEMSKKLKIKISDVRATLNKLHSLGVVDYTRHKDSETGWFSYFWCLNVDRMKAWVNEKVEEERRNLDFSGAEHYFCPNCGGASIHEFVAASDYGFKCPTCSSSLDFLSEEKAEELFPMRAFRKPLL